MYWLNYKIRLTFIDYNPFKLLLSNKKYILKKDNIIYYSLQRGNLWINKEL